MPVNLYDTRTMLTAIEMMMPTKTFLRDTFFTNRDTFLTEHVDVDYTKGRRKLAPFVSPVVEGTVMDRQGFTTKSFKPAAIKPKRSVSAGDLQQRSMGEGIYSAKGPDERAAELLAKDLSDLDDFITRREEWMAAQVLFTGQVRVRGEGVDRAIDFDFTNKEALSGTNLWSDAGSDPIADLRRWKQAILKKSGLNPDRLILASDVVEAFINHAKVKEKLDNRRIILGQINPQDMPNGTTYIGNLTEIGVDIYSYDEWYFDEEEGTEKPMVPEGTAALLSTRAQSSFLYGAVTLTDEMTKNLVTYEGARVPDSWINKDPAARWLQIHSRPLPVPHEVDSWYVATVL